MQPGLGKRDGELYAVIILQAAIAPRQTACLPSGRAEGSGG